MTSVTILNEAEQELLEAVAYYEGKTSGLGLGFPYLVVYAYVNAHVWIIAFAHCKRNPCYWSGRFVMEGE